MTPPTTRARRLFNRGTWPEASRIADLLRTETIGGALLLIAAVAALIWANSPWRDGYTGLRDAHLGPDFLHLNLSLAHWAADGLLAVFFFVVGLELKHEFVAGDLQDRAKAAVPIVAAACGVAVPAIVYSVVNLVGGGDLSGWAIPSATDIAFALAVLAVLGSHLPSALRTFLLTLAVVDDLIAITIIAFFFTSDLNLAWLAVGLVPLALFWALTRRGIGSPWLLIPLGVLTWVAFLNSGVHATIAGVLLGLAVPVHAVAGRTTSLNHVFQEKVRPLSSGVCVPIFAFFAAGVTVVGGGFSAAVRDPITLGIVFGLVVGKLVGVLGSTFVMAKFTRAELDPSLSWLDIVGLSLLAGIGFTVSLLVGELAFGAGSEADEHVKIGVLAGSLISALAAAAVLHRRNAVYRSIHEQESRDDDRDGIPDVYQQND